MITTQTTPSFRSRWWPLVMLLCMALGIACYAGLWWLICKACAADTPAVNF